jgi:hypothetical protein
MSSINLGNEGIQACRALRGLDQWDRFRAALGDAADKAVDQAIGSDPARRIEDTAYARGLRDLWIAIEAATTETHQKNVAKRPTTGASVRKAADPLGDLVNV